MTARWPDPDRANIGRYVASLDLRNMKSRACYRQVLHGFQDVAERYDALGQEVLLAWLRESGVRRAPSTLLHRTRIIDRFLERLMEIGRSNAIPSSLCAMSAISSSACRSGGHWRRGTQNRLLPNCANPSRSAACWAK
jgi:hypothetical protein